MPLGWVHVPPVPLKLAVLTDVQVRHRSSLAIGTHRDFNITFNEGGSAFSAVNRRMGQATENGQRCCKDKKEGKITQGSLHTTDIKHILATDSYDCGFLCACPNLLFGTSFWGRVSLHATPSTPFALHEQGYNLPCTLSTRRVFGIKSPVQEVAT